MRSQRPPDATRNSSRVCASRIVTTPVVANVLLSAINAGRNTPL